MTESLDEMTRGLEQKVEQRTEALLERAEELFNNLPPATP